MVLLFIVLIESTKEFSNQTPFFFQSTLGVQKNFLRSEECDYPKKIDTFLKLFLRRILNPLVSSDFIYNLTPEGRQSAEITKELKNFTKDILKERKRERLLEMSSGGPASELTDREKRKKQSLLDLLLTYHMEDGLMTEEEVGDQLDNFTFAGHDTTAMTLTFAFWAIARYPEVQEKLQKEVDNHFSSTDEILLPAESVKSFTYMDMFIKEVSTLNPVNRANHISSQDTKSLSSGSYDCARVG